jgi:tetratricopeptide (TPR) repeat protein
MRILVPLFLMALFAAADTNTSALAEKLRQRKIDRFFKSLEEEKGLHAGMKEQLLKLREGALLGGEYGAIHLALLERYPAYRRADTLLLDERFAAASEAFVEIAKDEDEYLKAYALYRYGLAEMNREEFETAIESFTRVLNDYGRYVGCDIEAAYWLAVSLGQAREKEKAIVAAQRFLEDYPDAPERFRRSMEQMKNELVQEWESPLYDLSGRMSRVSKRIEGGDTGAKTQGEQKEIVSIIDELIRRAEQQEGQGQNQGGGGGGGQPRNNRQPSSPLDRSTAPRGGGGEAGDLRPKPTKKPGQQWGDMRDKEREEVLQALKQKFPDRYRELLEQYHKALAEGKRVTEPGEEAGDGN